MLGNQLLDRLLTDHVLDLGIDRPRTLFRELVNMNGLYLLRTRQSFGDRGVSAQLQQIRAARVKRAPSLVLESGGAWRGS